MSLKRCDEQQLIKAKRCDEQVKCFI